MIKTKEYAVLEYLLNKIVNCKDYRNYTLPSENSLVQTFKYSRTTIRRALQRLEDFNIIIRKPGSGTALLRSVGEWEARKILRLTDDDKANYMNFVPLGNVVLAQKNYKIIFFHELHHDSPRLLDIHCGIRDAAVLRNHCIEIASFRKYHDNPDLSWSPAVTQNDADALIIGANLSYDEYIKIRKLGKPYIVIFSEHQENNSLVVNSALNCEYALHQFATAGHKHVAVIDFIPDNQPRLKLHTASMIEAMQKSMKEFDELIYCNNPLNLSDFFATYPQITAIYCSEDHKLLELLDTAEKFGRRPGDDLEITVLYGADLSIDVPRYVGKIRIDWRGIGAWSLKLIEQMLDTNAQNFPPVNITGLYIPPGKH